MDGSSKALVRRSARTLNSGMRSLTRLNLYLIRCKHRQPNNLLFLHRLLRSSGRNPRRRAGHLHRVQLVPIRPAPSHAAEKPEPERLERRREHLNLVPAVPDLHSAATSGLRSKTRAGVITIDALSQ